MPLLIGVTVVVHLSKRVGILGSQSKIEKTTLTVDVFEAFVTWQAARVYMEIVDAVNIACEMCAARTPGYNSPFCECLGDPIGLSV